MTGLLIRKLIDDAVAKLKILIGRYRMQVIDTHTGINTFAPSFHMQFDFLADVAVEDGRQRHELGDQVAVYTNQYVARSK